MTIEETIKEARESAKRSIQRLKLERKDLEDRIVKIESEEDRHLLTIRQADQALVILENAQGFPRGGGRNP